MNNVKTTYLRRASLLFILVCANILTVAAQQISVTVLNAEDKEPVPFATVAFPALQYGFSTNAEGVFVLKVDASNRNQNLLISNIGYHPYTISIQELSKHSQDTILLKPKVTVLREITVKADRESAEEMIKETGKSLQLLLGKHPYYLYGYYTEEVIKNSFYAGYTEAYGIFHIAGYQPNYNRKNQLFSYDIAQWKNIRRTKYTVNSECNSSKKRTLEIDKLNRAKSEYLYNSLFEKKVSKQFRFTVDSITSFNNTDVFVIGFRPIDPKKFTYTGMAYIKVDDYALLRLDINDNNAENILYPETCKVHKIKAHFQLDFTQVANDYYLKSTTLNTEYYVNTDTISEKISIIGGVFKKDHVTELNYGQRTILYQEMINPIIVYNESLWDENQRSLPKQLIEDKPKANRQFEFSNGDRIIPLPDGYDSYEGLYEKQDVFTMFLNANY